MEFDLKDDNILYVKMGSRSIKIVCTDHTQAEELVCKLLVLMFNGEL